MPLLPLNRILIWLAPLLLGLSTGVAAQPPFQNPRLLNVRNGLPDNFIHDVEQDQEGFTWIATGRGLCRYDGSRLVVIDRLPSDTSPVMTRRVNDILIDRRDNRLWLSTHAGLHVMDPKTGTFRSYLAGIGAKNLAHLRSDYTYQDRQGRIWVGNYAEGLALYRPETDDFERIRPLDYLELEEPIMGIIYLNQVTAMVQDVRDDDLYWLGTRQGLVRYDRRRQQMKLLRLHELDDLPKGHTFSIRALQQHTDGTLLLGWWQGGFTTYDPESGAFRAFMEADGQPIPSVFKIVPHEDGQFWITCSMNTLVLYDNDSGRIVRRWHGNRRDQHLYGVRMVDANGIIWAGQDRGLCLYHPLAQHVRHLQLEVEDEELLYSPAGFCMLDSQTFLTAFEEGRGIYRADFRNNTFTLFSQSEDAERLTRCRDLLRTRDGRLLVLTSDNLYEIDSQTRRLHPVRPPEEWAECQFTQLREDSRGDLWIGTYNRGVFHYDQRRQAWIHHVQELIPTINDRHAVWMWGFTEDQQGNIWFRAGTGYSVYLAAEERFINMPYRQGSADNFLGIMDVAADGRGRIWVIGDEVLGLIDPRHPERGVYQKLGADAGFRVVSPSRLVRDHRGDIWALGSSQLARISSEQLKFEHYNQHYGLPGYDQELDVEGLHGSVLQALPDGRLALLYRRGLAVFHPDSLRPVTQTVQPYLISFELAGKPYTDLASPFYLRQIRLRPRENFFSFEFSAINYALPNQTRFRYRLLGIDEDWIEAGERQYAAYTHLPGGDYTFQVMAASGDGPWNTTPYELDIVLPIPWHETTAVRLAIVLSLLGFGYTIYRIRRQQTLQRQRERAEFERQLANVEMNALRAQMNPHFIFNCLNSIDSFIIKNETHKASEYLNDFARLIRLILQNSRTNFVNLADELEALELYLQMEQLRFRQKFDFEINTAPKLNLTAIVLPPMLIQPYVENAIWHGLLHKRDGEAGHVSVDIHQQENTLVITITDNGIGRKRATEIKARHQTPSKQSMGMRITTDRIEMINQLYQTRASSRVVDLVDSFGEACGTMVELRIPV